MIREAVISDDLRYRYLLRRDWDNALPAVCFVMLNPSTADALQDDPTIRRCLGFAERLGFGRLDVVNLFALRSTDPSGLRQQEDPIGPANNDYIRRTVDYCDTIICAWGTGGHYMQRDVEVRLLILKCGRALYTLRHTKKGDPAHPLYLPNACELIEL